MNKILKDWFYALIEASIITLILYVLFWPINIIGSSMQPTFQSADKVFISKIPVFTKKIKRGDIIVCSAYASRKIIKRVIGIGGDHVVIKNSRVFLNGVEIFEPYSLGETLGSIDLYVPHNSLFILGDNRKISYDSRNIGCISYKNVLGKVLLRWFPFNKFNKF